MRIGNNGVVVQTRRIKIPRKGSEDLVFTVTGLPFGTDTEFSTYWPEPKVPTRTVQGVGGKKEIQYLADDPAYKLEDERRDHARLAFMFYKALVNDKDVQFDNHPQDKDSLWALAEEVKNSNLTGGEVLVIIRAAHAITNEGMNDGDVESLFV